MRRVAAILFFTLAALGQAGKAVPIATTVCELAGHPEQFAGKMVSVRGLAVIAFEQFEISAQQCAIRKFDAIWLEVRRRT
jgi:hypothetical protein